MFTEGSQSFCPDGEDPFFAGLLTPEEHVNRMQPGVALDDNGRVLAMQHFDFGMSVATKASVGFSPEARAEAIGDGLLGLVDASRRFHDWQDGANFETYAPHRIRGEIIDGQRREHRLAGPNRTSARVVSQFNNTKARSLDAPFGGGEAAGNLHDVVSDMTVNVEEDALGRIFTEDFYGRVELTDRQKRVVFCKARRLRNAEIASIIGVSVSTVKRDYSVAVKEIRHAYEDKFDFSTES